MKASRLAPWQIILVVTGAVLMLGPITWDILSSIFTGLQEIDLEEVFTRGGAFLVGLILLIIVGVYEIYEDFKDKPKSKHVK